VLPFAVIFQRALERSKLSQRQFALAVPCNQTLVSKVLRQERTPPLDRLDRWMQVLHLPQDERESFRLAALLAHAPPELVKMWTVMESKLAALERAAAPPS